jgi:hypothetical protein
LLPKIITIRRQINCDLIFNNIQIVVDFMQKGNYIKKLLFLSAYNQKLNMILQMELVKRLSMTGVRFFPALLLAVALIFSGSLQAQNNAPEEEERQFRYSDEELVAFFDVNQEISVVQRETQARIANTIEGHDLTMDRFNQIAQAAQIGALQEGVFTSEEINAFNEAAPKVNNIQSQMQQEMMDVISAHGLTTQRYQHILNDYRSDQELQAHVRELLRERARQQIREQREREAAEQQEEN